MSARGTPAQDLPPGPSARAALAGPAGPADSAGSVASPHAEGIGQSSNEPPRHSTRRGSSSRMSSAGSATPARRRNSATSPRPWARPTICPCTVTLRPPDGVGGCTMTGGCSVMPPDCAGLRTCARRQPPPALVLEPASTRRARSPLTHPTSAAACGDRRRRRSPRRPLHGRSPVTAPSPPHPRTRSRPTRLRHDLPGRAARDARSLPPPAPTAADPGAGCIRAFRLGGQEPRPERQSRHDDG